MGDIGFRTSSPTALRLRLRLLCWHRLGRLGSVCFGIVLFSLGAASHLPGQARLSFESRIAANGDGEAVLTNQSNAPIVAYVFEILREPCNPIDADRHIFAGYVAGATPDAKAIQPFASRAQNIGGSHCNKDGVYSPAKASLKAALFADGTRFGEERWVTALLDNCKFELKKIDAAIKAMQEIKRTEPREECVALLEKARASFHQMPEPRVEFSGADPFEAAIRQLADDQTAPLENQVADLVAALQATRSKIQNELRSFQLR